MLYVLLAGRHPVGEAGSLADLVKAIVDTEPVRLSAAVAAPSTQATETLAESAVRASTPDRLRRLLEGDLDTIVATALKKDPAERYPSVTAFADDLRRYLSHDPIRARPDTLAYRASKFVRRNRVPVALAALATAALAAGLVGTLTQAQRATRQAALAEAERDRADREARAASEQRDFALRQLSRAEAINDLNSFLLNDAAPSGKPFTVGRLLAAAERLIEGQRGVNDMRVEMLVAIGRQYQLQDQDDQARRLLGQAYELAQTLSDRSMRAKAGCALASAIARAGETDRAETLIEEAQAELPNEPQFDLDRIFCFLRASEVARRRGDGPAGIERVEAAQLLLEQSRARSPALEPRVGMDLAESYRMAGRQRDAAAAFKEAFAQLVALGRSETETAGTLLNNWANAVRALGRPLEAERLYRQSIEIESADGGEQGISPMVLNNLGWALRDLHRLSEAKEYAERAYTRAMQASNEVVVYQSLLLRAGIYREAGDLSKAAAALSEVEPKLERMLRAGHLTFAALESEKALLAEARGELDRASVAADRASAIAEASTQGRDFVPRLLLRRSNPALRMRRLPAAEADAARALRRELEAGEPGTFSSRLGVADLALGRALEAQGMLA
jgi:tetratricopeptide (TPR) repeat protein